MNVCRGVWKSTIFQAHRQVSRRAAMSPIPPSFSRSIRSRSASVRRQTCASFSLKFLRVADWRRNQQLLISGEAESSYEWTSAKVYTLDIVLLCAHVHVYFWMWHSQMFVNYFMSICRVWAEVWDQTNCDVLWICTVFCRIDITFL